MIIFLQGPDYYRRQQKVKELTTFYRQKHPNFDFKNFDLAENKESYPAFKDFLVQQSLFDNFKMALITGISEAEPKEIKAILKEHLSDESIVLIISEEKKPGKELDFLARKPVYYQEFKKLNAEESAFFIRKEAEKRDLALDLKAREYLISWQEQTDAGTWALINELDKIALAGFPQPISVKNLESLITFSYQEKIFDLARILAGHNPVKRKMVALEQLLIQKEPAAYAFNMLSYGAPASLLLKLADYDVSVKSGGLGYEEILLDLALASHH